METKFLLTTFQVNTSFIYFSDSADLVDEPAVPSARSIAVNHRLWRRCTAPVVKLEDEDDSSSLSSNQCERRTQVTALNESALCDELTDLERNQASAPASAEEALTYQPSSSLESSDHDVDETADDHDNDDLTEKPDSDALCDNSARDSDSDPDDVSDLNNF